MHTKIETIYVGPTDFAGAKIVAKRRGTFRKQVTISYPYELSGTDVHLAAAKLLTSKPLTIVATTKHGYIWETT